MFGDFWDDLSKFGSGMIETVGENIDWMGGWLGLDNSTNPNTTTPIDHPVVDGNGQPAVPSYSSNNTVLLIALVLALGVLAFMAFKR